MKTLSFQQPWASLIAKGIKIVENRTWNTEYRGRFLIHASSRKVPKNFIQTLPMEMFESIDNEQILGNMPVNLSELPTSAIIGYADIVDVIPPGELTGSPWDGGEDQYRWVIDNAHIFDEPITDVKGKLHFFDYPEIDENNLPPADKDTLHLVKYENKCLTICVAQHIYDYVKENGEFALHMVEDEGVLDCVLDDEGNLLDIERLELYDCDSLKATYKVGDSGFRYKLDENGNKLLGFSLYAADKENPYIPFEFLVLQDLELISEEETTEEE